MNNQTSNIFTASNPNNSKLKLSQKSPNGTIALSSNITSLGFQKQNAKILLSLIQDQESYLHNKLFINASLHSNSLLSKLIYKHSKATQCQFQFTNCLINPSCRINTKYIPWESIKSSTSLTIYPKSVAMDLSLQRKYKQYESHITAELIASGKSVQLQQISAELSLMRLNLLMDYRNKQGFHQTLSYQHTINDFTVGVKVEHAKQWKYYVGAATTYNEVEFKTLFDIHKQQCKISIHSQIDKMYNIYVYYKHLLSINNIMAYEFRQMPLWIGIKCQDLIDVCLVYLLLMLCGMCSNSNIVYKNRKANVNLCSKLKCYFQFEAVTQHKYQLEDYEVINPTEVLIRRKSER